MAKKSKSEALDDWRAAEDKYRKIIDQHLEQRRSAPPA